MTKFIKIFIFIIFFISILKADSYLDIDLKLNNTKKENKHLMIFFHIPYCPYCKSMLKHNFHDKKTLNLIEKKFILVDIYTANNNKIKYKNFKGTPKEFAKYIGADAYPATLFINNKGDVIHKAIGYRNIDEYIAELKYISTDNYKNMNLEVFKQKLEFEEYE